MRIDGTSPVSEGLSGQGGDGSTLVRSGENTLADVASRLGVSVEDLKNANPQLAGLNELSAGTEVRLPEGKTDKGNTTGDVDKDKQTKTDSGASKRMEGNLDAAAMRGILFSSLGSSSSPSSSSSSSAVAPQDGTGTDGGTAPQPPITLPRGTEGYSPAVKKDLTEKLQSLSDNPQFKALSPTEKDTVLKALTSDP